MVAPSGIETEYVFSCSFRLLHSCILTGIFAAELRVKKAVTHFRAGSAEPVGKVLTDLQEDNQGINTQGDDQHAAYQNCQQVSVPTRAEKPVEAMVSATRPKIPKGAS